MDQLEELPYNQILCGDNMKVMPTFPSNSIDIAITSPPYWGLRDYGIEENQLGLESHPNEYIEKIVETCREIKRILKPTGSFWLILGDTYYGSGKGAGTKLETAKEIYIMDRKSVPKQNHRDNWLQPKQLMGIPWRVAIALQNDGWLLRNSIIWSKPNAMPSSVKDRLTNKYEFIFFFVKKRKYFFDLDQIRLPYSEGTWKRILQKNINKQKGGTKTEILREGIGGNASKPIKMAQGLAKGLTKHDIAVNRIGNFSYTDPLHEREYDYRGKNPGDVWSISTYPFKGMHFATFPPKLIEPMVKSTCPEHVCSQCGKPREKIWDSVSPQDTHTGVRNVGGRTDGFMTQLGNTAEISARYVFKGLTKCECEKPFNPGIVLDPFAGSGTALRVARKLGRRFIGIELVEKYCEIARERVKSDKYDPAPEDMVKLDEFFSE